MTAALAQQDVRSLERILCPERPPTVWEWASRHLVLPDSESSSQGGFDRERAGLFRRWLDVIAARRMRRQLTATDPYADRTERLWGITSAQLGKTVNGIFTAASWQALHFPHLPMGIIWPRLELKKSQIRGRLEPLWQATPQLAALMPPIDSEDYSRRIGDRMWRLEHGLRIRMLCGSIANDLRANPLASIYCDEYDALPLDVGDQGNPLRLAEDRGRTWGADFLIVGKTTPTTVEGHGWRTLCQGTHERLLITCPECQGMDWLNPDQVMPLEDVDPTTLRRKDLAAWCCRWCGSRHRTDTVARMRVAAVAADSWCCGTWEITEDHPRGLWSPLAEFDGNGRLVGAIPPPDSETRSYQLNILYGKVWTLGRFLSEQQQAMAGSEEDQRAFWNTARAEVWLPQGLADISDEEKRGIEITGRARATVPAAATWLALMFDQQGNTDRLVWFPWVLRAIGPGGESWLIDCGKVDAAQDDATGGWAGVDRLCNQQWPKEGAGPMRASICIMDGANGNLATRVRGWAAQEPGRRRLIWGNARLKSDEPWKLYVPGKRAKIPWPNAVRGYELNSNYWRDRVDERRRRVPGAPGWWLPEDPPAYYLRSVWDSEVRAVVQRQVTGQGVREIIAWQPAQQADSKGAITFRRDNHWWDCEVAIAAMSSVMGWDDSGLSRNRKTIKRKFGAITTIGGRQ